VSITTFATGCQAGCVDLLLLHENCGGDLRPVEHPGSLIVVAVVPSTPGGGGDVREAITALMTTLYVGFNDRLMDKV
jgi:hypothetical protein